MLAIVLPDENGEYGHYYTPNPDCNSTTLHTDKLFPVLRDNMFNIKKPDSRECNGQTIYSGYHSYISSVCWVDFIDNIDKYVDIAVDIYKNRDQYEITKTIEK